MRSLIVAVIFGLVVGGILASPPFIERMLVPITPTPVSTVVTVSPGITESTPAGSFSCKIAYERKGVVEVDECGPYVNVYVQGQGR